MVIGEQWAPTGAPDPNGGCVWDVGSMSSPFRANAGSLFATSSSLRHRYLVAPGIATRNQKPLVIRASLASLIHVFFKAARSTRPVPQSLAETSAAGAMRGLPRASGGVGQG